MPDRRAPLQVHSPLDTNVLDVTRLLEGLPDNHALDALNSIIDAIIGASDQGQFTWLVNAGKPAAAIVPVDSAEDILGRLGQVLARVRQATGAHGPDRGPEPGR